MATNINEPWGECEILSSEQLSDEEVHRLLVERYGTAISLEDSVAEYIESLIKEGANINNKNGLLTMDMNTLLRIIETYIEY